ncbi:efflux RND transporter permease subunit [Enterobacter sp. DTU_2021_1002640_1_SI_PRY_ASU_LCPMC_013]|uniref:efflux RND transporter permease subunit n=1 Tax=Enterobacter sp. DTU_2021_1002640_1_SI_PRY_ASU_LCPMC_013 TaxID=3077940 RepID=UPI0028E49901|nr:efflux RND transporter permease subunit [Enterobacter sp. DTU_2021_1002640_1_SI_PRY_ASU_LCPMC_013]WNU99168.1 efflux RND transporter permease subunit [Enterobacter sp. DTU_2021_1002640_1_SI_PRY_ASU_LCPMC_013]
MNFEKYNLSSWALGHQQLVSFLLLIIMVAGCLSFTSLSRDEDPAFTIKTAIISADWPGASPEEMVNLVADPIEKTVQELRWFDSVDSQTRAGHTEVTVNLLDATPPAEVKPSWQELRKKMRDIAATLPDSVGEPVVNDEYDATYGTIYGITADGFSNAELRDITDRIQRELRTVKDIGRTVQLGIQHEQIVLSFSARQLSTMGISPDDIMSALRKNNAVTPSGSLRTLNDRVSIDVSGTSLTEGSLKHISLRSGDRTLPLTDIVSITRKPPQTPEPVFHVNGQPAQGIAIAMLPGGNMLEFGPALDQKLEQIKATLPHGITVSKIANQPAIVDEAVDGFLHVLMEAIVIVMAVSFVSLGLRAGLVVAVAIPIVLALTFTGMELAGIGLQRISLGALIIALGLLVDDAMITIESMVSHLEKGEPLRKAASSAFVKTAFPMLTGTLVMIAGFIPVGFAKSMAGEYCYSLFAVIFISLLSSWVVAVLFSPISGVWLLAGAKLHKHDENRKGRLSRAYESLLSFSLRHRLAITVSSVLLFGLSVWSSQWLKSEFFPASDRPELLISMTLPENTTQQATESLTKRLEQILDKEDGVQSYSSYIGTGAVRFYLPMDVLSDAENISQLVVVAKDLDTRKALQAKLTGILHDQFSDIVTRISPLELGPPVGWPLKYRVTGPDFNQTRIYARQLSAILSKDPRVTGLNMTAGDPQRAVNIHIDQTAAGMVGLTSERIADTLNMFYSGVQVTELREGNRRTEVILQASEADRNNLAGLEGTLITSESGARVPLSQVGSFSWGLKNPEIQRRNRESSVTIQADVTNGQNVDNVGKELLPRIEEFREKMPTGYNVSVSGASEESDKGNDSLMSVLPVTIIVMLGVMMIQLQSYSRVILATLMAPFGFIGVVAALLPTGTPLGFVALLGVIALSGMIIRNAIILISEVDENLKLGLANNESIVNAAKHRARPIMLTACAAIFGMIPIARQVFWGPMAFAIIGGLVAATFFTLTLLPALLSFLLDHESRRTEEIQ